MSRSVSAVSMATSEYCSCPPRLPTPTASHVAIASGVNHRVTSPRWTSARSYAGQFPTRYFVLYLGCTLDFTSRSCPFGRHDGQGRDEHLFPRTNAGEWAAVKHGGRGIRGWKKLHLGVDGSGVIVAHALTGGHVDDATTALDLIDKVEGDVSCLTADAAYDTRGIYEAAGARGATVVIPPTRTATVSGRRPRSPARDRTIRQVQQAGRRQWKKDSGYHQQARVENAFFRYKLIIGESLRARSRAGQETEAILACNILNQMTQLGRPASYAIGR